MNVAVLDEQPHGVVGIDDRAMVRSLDIDLHQELHDMAQREVPAMQEAGGGGRNVGEEDIGECAGMPSAAPPALTHV